MLRQLEAGKNPNATVNLLKAIQWTRAAWNDDVKATTIQKCFWKSTLIKKPQEMPQSTISTIADDIRVDRQELEAEIRRLPILNPLPLDDFIEPQAEAMVDDELDILAAVVEAYSVDKVGEEGTYGCDMKLNILKSLNELE